MKLKSWLLVLITMIALAGCDAKNSSRLDGLPLSEVKLDGRVSIGPSSATNLRYTVRSVDLIVPETLRVSEENLFYPDADVVWRGEPHGDRPMQISAILDEGLNAGASGAKQGAQVTIKVQLERFHALTEKARFSIGGVHDIVFVLTVLDFKTNAILEGPRRVEVAIKASGNDKAIAEDAAGRTQRVVIVEGVAEAIRRELSGTAP